MRTAVAEEGTLPQRSAKDARRNAMRYTPEATMEHQGLRDVDRWKDKIEVRLDNRQVAFLFFGSALVACMLFILGVIVGKRLESRGRAMAPEIEDPLALLDRVAASTRGAETGGPARAMLAVPPRVSRLASPAVARAEAAPPTAAAVAPAAPPARREAVALAPAAVAKLPPAPAPAAKAPVAAPAAARAAVPAVAKSATPEVPVAEAPAPPPPAARPSAPAVSPASLTASAAKEAGKAKPRFMLQIGSFPDRAEAEAFAGTFTQEKAAVVVSELPGKGTWYRVRVGDFRAFKDAVDAKTQFEKRYNKIALVVGPL
jgi:hypothetical protein